MKLKNILLIFCLLFNLACKAQNLITFHISTKLPLTEVRYLSLQDKAFYSAEEAMQHKEALDLAWLPSKQE